MAGGLLTLLLLVLPGQADAGVSPRLALVVSQAQGLSVVEQQALRDALGDGLALYGATVRPSSLSGALQASCLNTPACCREAARGLQVDALLDVRALRVGPSLRLTLRVLAGPSGELVEELQASTLASDPAAELAVHDALQRAAAIARRYTPPDLEPARHGPSAGPPDGATATSGPPPPVAGGRLDLRPLWRALATSAAGLGAGLLLGGVVSGLLAVLTLQELEGCLDDACAQKPALDVRARRLVLGGSLLLAGGALCTAGGVGGLLLATEAE